MQSTPPKELNMHKHSNDHALDPQHCYAATYAVMLDQVAGAPCHSFHRVVPAEPNGSADTDADQQINLLALNRQTPTANTCSRSTSSKIPWWDAQNRQDKAKDDIGSKAIRQGHTYRDVC